MKKTIQAVIIALFFAFLMAVDTQMMLRLVPEPTLLEKRPLAPRPVLVQISEVFSDKFTSAFDAYTNDNLDFVNF